jgi:hypothetical protein
MKTKEFYMGAEVLRHQAKINDINKVFDFLKKHKIKQSGDKFVALYNGDHRQFVFFDITPDLDVQIGYVKDGDTYQSHEVFSYKMFDY